jgi:hypothetical protein
VFELLFKVHGFLLHAEDFLALEFQDLLGLGLFLLLLLSNLADLLVEVF